MEKELTEVYCGGGIGKTTLALGQSLKASMQGKSVIVIQFLKGKEKRELDFLEELDNLALNVLVHRGFENKYPGIYQGQNSFLFREGVNLYPKLFFEFGADKTGLKDRVSEKYGHMKAGDDKHPASKMANEIKQLDLIA